MYHCVKWRNSNAPTDDPPGKQTLCFGISPMECKIPNQKSPSQASDLSSTDAPWIQLNVSSTARLERVFIVYQWVCQCVKWKYNASTDGPPSEQTLWFGISRMKHEIQNQNFHSKAMIFFSQRVNMTSSIVRSEFNVSVSQMMKVKHSNLLSS